MTKSLVVWWGDRPTGRLEINADGDLVFTYDPAWLADPACPPLSQSLPKQVETFGRRASRPFFAGLLPDERVREAVARTLGVSKENDFGLLLRLGGEVAGALSLYSEGELPAAPLGLAATEPLTDKGLADLIESLPRRPLLAGEGRVRLSLAGAQPKVPVVLINGRVGLPAEGQPSTHILKPAIDVYPATTENEAFVMRLAAAVGLRTAAVEPRVAGGRSFLLVERYDRIPQADGSIRRLHQEDACQALGVSPETKYAAEGGPRFPDLFDLIRRATQAPAGNLLRLLDAALFNLIVGNADAHGKNFSLLYAPTGAELAPLYDLMCTAAYPEVHPNLAMKMGRRATLDAFRPDTLDLFATEIGMGAGYVRRRAGALAVSVSRKAQAVADALAAPDLDSVAMRRYAELVTRRAAQLGALLDAR
jgi:serine/threonine-protein kinase HipA